ncbi:MAG: transglycosylase SLT domain-containing protein, partial [Deltaproteobacteria bacterium]|nr:transglycosylase SLT domain-containing protein [Deltaproteobacteria bacterium]
QRALFKVGLLAYLTQNYEQAQTSLEGYLNISSSQLGQAQAHYWLYKTALAQKSKNISRKHQNILLQDYAYTYYATILPKHPKIEKIGKPLPFANADNQVAGIELFLQLGLHQLVSRALFDLDDISSAQKFALAKKLDHLSMYLPSMNLTYKLMLTEQALYPEILHLFFPIAPYTNFFTTPKAYKVPSLVALSIMKQESAFNPLAVSAANAHGLLQLIMPTARRMAQHNHIKINKWDLFTPTINIQLGTTYIARNLQQLDNNLIDTFIAYNAGPTRAKRWKNQWAELDNDVYIEMIPIQETRTYVKLILRNIYFYQRLYPEYFNETIDYKGLPEHFVKH